MNLLARCNECGKDFSRGYVAKNSTNLRAHLKHKHPQLFDELLRLCKLERCPPENPTADSCPDAFDDAATDDVLDFPDIDNTEVALEICTAVSQPIPARSGRRYTVSFKVKSKNFY